MKRLVFIFSMTGCFTCTSKVKIDDTSLKINVSTANDACSCNQIAISIMKEQISIFKQIRIYGKSNTQLNQELKKRDAKHHEYYMHCKPIYEIEGMGSKCNNYKEADSLDKEINRWRIE